MEDLQRHRRDWVSSPRSYIVAWGIPTTALILGALVPPPWKTLIWVLALLWMGAACLANAARCGRTHCFFTGPLFFLTALFVMLHGFEIVGLGPNGWMWLGAAIVTGTIGVWIVTEKVWGKFIRRGKRPT